mmetsp:Transcript_27456/g.35441  ORF Transcript_27456/g.35441 Transcript_27456/m.35441 type:complete len:100 (-) Transcript_27456:15-314(-)
MDGAIRYSLSPIPAILRADFFTATFEGLKVFGERNPHATAAKRKSTRALSAAFILTYFFFLLGNGLTLANYFEQVQRNSSKKSLMHEFNITQFHIWNSL